MIDCLCIDAARRRLLRSTGLLIGGAVIDSAVPALWTGTAHGSEAPVVETQNGRVRGAVDRGVFVFRGIRYGAPTGGPNRFMPPQAPQPWSGVQDALHYGNSCIQSNPHPAPRRTLAAQIPPGPAWPKPPESEDCLFLNVWTQGLSDGGKRPVMVWLHGGAFISGSASEAAVDGTHIARRGNVVCVGINHRLNVFGYCNLADLGDRRFSHSGNAGMLDIVAALKWVRANIERFGGDPRCVTIFGESGGGQKVSMLLACPPSKGLFHRAIIESGPGVKMLERADADRCSHMLLQELGLPADHPEQLQAVLAQRLLAAYFAVVAKLPPPVPGLPMPFSPVLDPNDLPAHPFYPVASPVHAEVPLLIGSNHDEITLFAAESDFTLDEAGLRMRLAHLFGDEAESVLAGYRRIYPKYFPSDMYLRIATDYPTMQWTINICERKFAQHAAAVYRYRFDWETPILGGRLRSMHSLEVPFVFYNIERARNMIGPSEGPVVLAGRMCDAWTTFAATGDPNTPRSGLPKWPAYDPRVRETMLFADRSRVVADPDKAERAVLDPVMNPGLRREESRS
jgi:para-nitrobenzyl esterase